MRSTASICWWRALQRWSLRPRRCLSSRRWGLPPMRPQPRSSWYLGPSGPPTCRCAAASWSMRSEPESVPAALGFDNATMYATRALGPLIGGATYQALGISGIYALIAMSYLVCLGLGRGVGVCIRGTEPRHRPRPTGLSAAAAGARSRSALPDHHGCDARL